MLTWRQVILDHKTCHQAYDGRHEFIIRRIEENGPPWRAKADYEITIDGKSHGVYVGLQETKINANGMAATLREQDEK